jgi:hypothetical protein
VHVPAAAPARDLQPRDRLAEEHRGLEVDVDDLVERLLGHLEQRLLVLHAQAVDEEVGHAVALGGELDRDADRVGRARVERERVRRRAAGLELARERDRLGLVAAGDHARARRAREPRAIASPM